MDNRLLAERTLWGTARPQQPPVARRARHVATVKHVAVPRRAETDGTFRGRGWGRSWGRGTNGVAPGAFRLPAKDEKVAGGTGPVASAGRGWGAVSGPCVAFPAGIL